MYYTITSSDIVQFLDEKEIPFHKNFFKYLKKKIKANFPVKLKYLTWYRKVIHPYNKKIININVTNTNFLVALKKPIKFGDEYHNGEGTCNCGLVGYNPFGENIEVFVNWKRSNLDTYLLLLIYYHMIVYLLELGCKDLLLTDMNEGSYPDVLVNQESDIISFFDAVLVDNISDYGHQKGSNLIPYLKEICKIAKDMEGFPTRWKNDVLCLLGLD